MSGASAPGRGWSRTRPRRFAYASHYPVITHGTLEHGPGFHETFDKRSECLKCAMTP